MDLNPMAPASMTEHVPRAAYVHVPFCARRCGYCNFTVVADRGDLAEQYLAAIERELSWLQSPRPVDTLYVGGGTPTQLELHHLRRLGRLLRRWFPPSGNCEFTVEANPNDVTEEVIEELAAMGANRLSLGVQSLDRDKLLALDRDHTAGDVERAVQLARQRITNISLDLIFGAPGETVGQWRRDLASALALRPNHISAYGLTYERGTSFGTRRAKGALAPLGEETERTMYLVGIDQLLAGGMEHYEVSNFAKPAYRSRHNQVYWSGGSYYAVGPGASRYVGGRRETNHRSTFTYLRRVLAGESPVAESERLTPEDQARERLVFGLRMLDGVDARQFAQQTGYHIARLTEGHLEGCLRHGLLRWSGSRLRLTREGLLVSDSIWPRFLRA